MMARLGDSGPCSAGNVHCVTPQGNAEDVRPEVRFVANFISPHRGGAPCGSRHGKARRAQAPKRVFETATEAARHFEITRQHAARLAREGREGWRYL